jgi:hypothetical protein
MTIPAIAIACAGAAILGAGLATDGDALVLLGAIVAGLGAAWDECL